MSSSGSLFVLLILSACDNFGLPLAVGTFGPFENIHQLLTLLEFVSVRSFCSGTRMPGELTVVTAFPVWSTTMTVFTRLAMIAVEESIKY